MPRTRRWPADRPSSRPPSCSLRWEEISQIIALAAIIQQIGGDVDVLTVCGNLMQTGCDYTGTGSFSATTVVTFSGAACGDRSFAGYECTYTHTGTGNVSLARSTFSFDGTQLWAGGSSNCLLPEVNPTPFGFSLDVLWDVGQGEGAFAGVQQTAFWTFTVGGTASAGSTAGAFEITRFERRPFDCNGGAHVHHLYLRLVLGVCAVNAHDRVRGRRGWPPGASRRCCLRYDVRMIISISRLAAAVVLLLPLTVAAQQPIPLFNGKDLSGWTHFLVDPKVPASAVWSVKDGVLVCKGEPVGYLYTTSEYTSFTLIVEWRWAPGAASRLGKVPNSGVLMRINGEPKPGGVPRAYEAQLQVGNAGDAYGFWGLPLDGDAGRRREAKGHELLGDMTGFGKLEAAERPEGEWNRYEITLDGPSFVVILNGKKVNEAKGAAVIPGPIGLQSEGGEIHFRRVELKPIGK